MNNIDRDIVTSDETRKTKCVDYTIEGMGWIGSGFVLSAYLLNLNEYNNFLLNTLGSGALIGICYKKRVYQPLIINGLWIIIGVYKYFL